MKYIKAGYNRKFPMEQFGNENPYVEIEIEDGDDPLAVLQEAKNLLYKFHEQSVKQDEEKQVVDISGGIKTTRGSFTQSIKKDIDKETTLEGLNTFDVLVNGTKNPELISYLEQRKKQFKNG